MSTSGPYAVLGVGPTASAEEIRSGYVRALRAGEHDRATVTDAFAALRDPVRRAECDLFEADTGVAAGLVALLADGSVIDFVDERAVALPSWDDLVVAPPPTPPRVPPALPADAEGAPPAWADVVPPPELPL